MKFIKTLSVKKLSNFSKMPTVFKKTSLIYRRRRLGNKETAWVTFLQEKEKSRVLALASNLRA